MTILAGTYAIESDRLLLRRLHASDLDFLVALHADEEVARYIGTGKPRSAAETDQWFDDTVASYATAELGQLMVVRKSDGVRLGRCGLSDAAIERSATSGQLRKGWFFSAYAPPGAELECVPELGYTFAKGHWGQGYATEAAAAVFDYAQKERSFGRVMSLVHGDNAASHAVVGKFDTAYVERLEVSGRVFERYDWPVSSR